MQLHTPQTPPSETDDDESGRAYRDRATKSCNKRTSKKRRKVLAPSQSLDTVLDFEDECAEDNHLPDLVKDTNVYRINIAFSDCPSNGYDENDNKHNSNPANDPCESETSKTTITKKKFSLPNDRVDEAGRRSSQDLDSKVLKKRFSLPTDVTESRPTVDSKVEEFMQEVISSISEIGNGNPEAVRKLRGIIKRTLSGDRENGGNVICIKRREKTKNKVHFSEENITIEIPRPPTSTIKEIKDILCYFCCFGFLFPNV